MIHNWEEKEYLDLLLHVMNYGEVRDKSELEQVLKVYFMHI